MENNNKKQKKKWEDLVVELFMLLLKPLDMFSTWLSNLILKADTELKRIEGYIVVLVVIAGLISIMIIIPTLGNIMEEESVNETTTEMENFTLCLTHNGVSLYGESDNTSMINQKQLFEESFEYLVYIDCTEEIDKCNAERIEINPTWIIEAEKHEKVLSIDELSNLSGCEYEEED